MQNFFKTRKFWLLLGVSLMIPFFSAMAQDDDYDDEDEDDEEEEVNWQDTRSAILKEISAEVDRRVRATVSHEKIVNLLAPRAKSFEDELKDDIKRQRDVFFVAEQKKWSKKMIEAPYPKFDFEPKQIPGWSWPISEPAKSIEQIKNELENKLAKIFTEAYPPKSNETLKEEGQKKYPMVEDVDKRPRVAFKLRGGFGTNTKVDGKLQRLNSERLQVSGRWINRHDLDDETQAMFYKDVNDEFVNDYVEDELRRYKVTKESFILDWCDYLLPEALMCNGYIPNNYLEIDEATGRPDSNIRLSVNTKKWISRKEYEKKFYDTLYNVVKKKIAKDLEKDFFENAEARGLYSENFVIVQLYDDALKATGEEEWMPVSEAEAYKAELERKKEEKKRKEQDPFGMNPLDPGAGMPIDMGVPR